jgi:hypothetical protein
MKYYNKIAEESRKNFSQFSYYFFYKKISVFRAKKIRLACNILKILPQNFIPIFISKKNLVSSCGFYV